MQLYTRLSSKKRGLPHAHILVFLHPDDKYLVPEDIDSIISAESPDSLEIRLDMKLLSNS